MPDKRTILTRQKLFDQIGTKPATHLAKEPTTIRCRSPKPRLICSLLKSKLNASRRKPIRAGANKPSN